jgi:hypothetical protein
MPLFRAKIDLTRYLKYGNGNDVRRRIDETAAYLFEVSPETKEIASIVATFGIAFESVAGAAAGPADGLLKGYTRNKFTT